MNSLALKLYEARHLKKSFTGQILYRSLDPSKKRRQNIFYQKIWFYSNFPLVLSDVPYKIEKKSSHFPGFLIFFKILKTIKENGHRKYAKCDSIMNERHEQYPRKIFPKIIVCSNSMHSKHKLEENYGYINNTLLEALYGGCKHDCEKSVRPKTIQCLKP